MKVISMSESLANYAATLDSVINDQEEIVITRPDGEDVVMIPLREYESMRETLYLMSSPLNRQRISRSIEQLNRGHGQVREVINPDARLEADGRLRPAKNPGYVPQRLRPVTGTDSNPLTRALLEDRESER